MPVVDGLEADFAGQVSILRLNAGELDNQQLMADYAVVGHPAFAVIDAEGKVIQRLIGAQTETTLRGAITSMLGENS